MTRKERTVLFNLFYRAGLAPSFSEVMELSAEEGRKRLEAVRSKRYPQLTLEDMLLGQPRCGIHSCRAILKWIGVPPRAERTTEDMRQEIRLSLPTLSEEQVRAMWRALRRSKS